MPHVDEFFAATSLAAAGLAVAIALHPVPSPAANDPAIVRPLTSTTTAAAAPGVVIVRLPTIEVVARRSDGLAIAAGERAPRSLKPAA